MKLKKFLGNLNRYTRTGLEIKDFIWVDVEKLHIPWRPICEMNFKRPKTEKSNSREMCPVVPILMRDEKDQFNTLIKYSMHVKMLDLYEKHKESLLTDDTWKKSKYYLLHKSYREIGLAGSLRDDAWILYKIKKFIALFEDIKKNGYCYTKKSYLSVLDRPMSSYYGYEREIDGHEIWDGFHRASCLYKLGYRRIKALLLEKRSIHVA